MTRRPRVVIPGMVHHVTQRGNHQQTGFYSGHDRRVYLRLLADYFSLYEIRLIGHDLMDNHVHLAVIPKNETSLAEGIGLLHHDFARWQNIQRHTSGHLWQSRFFSCPVEDDRVWQVLSYVELNPVRAHMVEHAWEWEWSSAQAHVNGRDPSGLLDMGYWRRVFDEVTWKKFLEQAAAEAAARAQIRRATARGFFLGSEVTARKLEQELGIQLLPRRRGRKRRPPAMPQKLGKF